MIIRLGSSKLAGGLLVALLLLSPAQHVHAAQGDKGDFRVPPYIPTPASDAMTVVWFSEEDRAGRVSYRHNAEEAKTVVSKPLRADALAHFL